MDLTIFFKELYFSLFDENNKTAGKSFGNLVLKAYDLIFLVPVFLVPICGVLCVRYFSEEKQKWT
jgi:hypothetical protein